MFFVFFFTIREAVPEGKKRPINYYSSIGMQKQRWEYIKPEYGYKRQALEYRSHIRESRRKMGIRKTKTRNAAPPKKKKWRIKTNWECGKRNRNARRQILGMQMAKKIKA